jgi:hypothetical protein
LSMYHIKIEEEDFKHSLVWPSRHK